MDLINLDEIFSFSTVYAFCLFNNVYFTGWVLFREHLVSCQGPRMQVSCTKVLQYEL